MDPAGDETRALRQAVNWRGKRVLEVGCGDGRLTYRFAPWTRSVLGIDPDEERIAIARRGLPAALADRVRFAVRDAVDLAQPPAAFDAVFLSHSL
jgi:ubiquinone/menaquinone biosynthesis C-methylase UbiE